MTKTAVDPSVTPESVEKHGLTAEEFERIKKILGREPNFTELGIFSVMWSEHCSYKNSRKELRKLPTTGPRILVKAGEENAGVVDIGNGWAILFSHPKDFTPICTTELGYMAKLKPEFDKRNTKIIGLSVDPVTDHSRWMKDIEETQGAKVEYPLIGDADLNVAKLYDMIHPNASGANPRTANDNATIRAVFLIGPDKKVKATFTYPMSAGRNFDGARVAGMAV